eukprot:7247030-Prymnesium_polylepis.2
MAHPLLDGAALRPSGDILRLGWQVVAGRRVGRLSRVKCVLRHRARVEPGLLLYVVAQLCILRLVEQERHHFHAVHHIGERAHLRTPLNVAGAEPRVAPKRQTALAQRLQEPLLSQLSYEGLAVPPRDKLCEPACWVALVLLGGAAQLVPVCLG